MTSRIVYEEFWYLRAKATRTRSLSHAPIGQEVVIYYDWLQGMSDSGQPGWSTSRFRLQQFKTADEAIARAKLRPPGSGWDYDKGHSPEPVFYRKKTVEEISEWTYDDWKQNQELADQYEAKLRELTKGG